MQIKQSFEDRFREILGDDYEEFVDVIQRPLNKSFRVNTLKVVSDEKRDELVESLRRKGLRIREVAWNKNSFFVDFQEDKRYDLGNLYEHFLGQIYVQEATSMIPVLALELEKMEQGDCVLDMCSAPGSKTTQIVELTGDKCFVVANELDYRRVSSLKINLERIGAKNIVITCADAGKIDFDQKFDRILLDAPCSGSGVIRKSPNTMKKYNPKKLRAMQNLQFNLFKNAYELLDHGGVLVYSTCSIDPEENELLVQRVLDEFEDLRIEKVSIDNLKVSNVLKSFEGKQILPVVYENVLRVWPQDNDTGGFFVAKFRKG